MEQLTAEERSIYEKYLADKKKHAEAQQRYRERLGVDTVREQNRQYYRNRRKKIEPVLKKVDVPTPIPLKEIAKEPVPVSKRTRRGKKRAQVNADVIKPMYETRKEPLALTTIKGYLQKANILQKLFDRPILTLEAKNEFKKLLNDNPNIDEKLLLNEMPYINNDILPTIEKLREAYPNDQSFKAYLLTLTVIASHLKTLDSNVYQTLTKSAIYMNKAIKEKREENVVDEVDKDKIIDLSRDVILDKISKLRSTEDKLLFAVYTLMPARRLDWRLVKLTYNLRPKEDDDNYLVLNSPKKVVFNNYKTKAAYGQQTFEITDPFLNDLIDQQIKARKLQAGNYLFAKQRDLREEIDGSIFSTKVSNVFKKVYGFPISVRFLRMSHASNFLKTNRSVKEMKEHAYAMAHSVEEQQLYKKIEK